MRNAYIVTLDPKLGDTPDGDVHVRNGLLELATLDGPKDCGIADRTAALTPDKRADLILVHTKIINVAPSVNLALLLVQRPTSNVDTVIIDGRILKHKGELIGIDAEEVTAKTSESFHAARKRAGGPCWRDTSPQWLHATEKKPLKT